MIAIPNMEKPEYCRVCHERLKCKQYDGEILHTPDDCPLIEMEEWNSYSNGKMYALKGTFQAILDDERRTDETDNK